MPPQVVFRGGLFPKVVFWKQIVTIWLPERPAGLFLTLWPSSSTTWWTTCEKKHADDLRQLEDRHTHLLRRALHQRRGRGHQQQSPRNHQALLRREVVRHALEPADPGPEPGVGGGGADHRRTTRNHVRPEGRISRVLHLKPEEPLPSTSNQNCADAGRGRRR